MSALHSELTCSCLDIELSDETKFQRCRYWKRLINYHGLWWWTLVCNDLNIVVSCKLRLNLGIVKNILFVANLCFTTMFYVPNVWNICNSVWRGSSKDKRKHGSATSTASSIAQRKYAKHSKSIQHAGTDNNLLYYYDCKHI